MIFLGCEHEKQVCYVTTANIDGETSSKVRRVDYFTRRNFKFNFEKFYLEEMCSK